jgi:AcrR family transcriptional regulator
VKYSHSRRQKRDAAMGPRKTPAQSRSQVTVDAILGAAAHILEKRGFEGYTTNAISARAGVSIGSLYQYFPNKDAITIALIDREAVRLSCRLKSALSFTDWRIGIARMIHVAVHYQLVRPQLARLLDIEEGRLGLSLMSSDIYRTIHGTVVCLLNERSPDLDTNCTTAYDVMAITRGLTDAAGARRETDIDQLERSVQRAVFGYLQGTA